MSLKRGPGDVQFQRFDDSKYQVSFQVWAQEAGVLRRPEVDHRCRRLDPSPFRPSESVAYPFRKRPCNARARKKGALVRSEEHTSELQSLMRNSYAVFCLQKKKK